MVVECGCNRAHRALKGDVYSEAYSFPSRLCLCSSSRARALSCHYEGSRGKRETKWFPGFYFNLKREEWSEEGVGRR